MSHLQTRASDGVEEDNHRSILGEVVIISVVNTDSATISKIHQFPGEVVRLKRTLVIELFDKVESEVGPSVAAPECWNVSWR